MVTILRVKALHRLFFITERLRFLEYKLAGIDAPKTVWVLDKNSFLEVTNQLSWVDVGRKSVVTEDPEAQGENVGRRRVGRSLLGFEDERIQNGWLNRFN